MSESDPDELMLRVPVVAETATIAKVAVQTDAVRVSTSVETRDEIVENTVTRGALIVKRVPVDRAVDVAPPPREEGSTTILSVVEERLVVEKRLFVVEEVHVTREQTAEHVAIPVTLRATRVMVERPTDTQATGNTSND